MLSNGRSKDNLHQEIDGNLIVDGDAEIKGDLTVDGSITGFNISNEVVCLNRWYSTNQTGVFAPALPPATILKNNTSTLSNSGEKTVGNNVIQGDDLEDANSFAIMNLKILNRVENNAGGDNINQFSIFLTTGGVTSDISWEEMNFGGFTLGTPGAYQNIEKTITFTKSAFNPANIICTVNCFKPSNDRSQNVPTSTNTDKFFTTSNFLKIGSQNGNIICPVSNSTTNNSTFILTGYNAGDDITVDIRVVKTANAPNVIEANLEYGTLNVYKQQQLPSGGGGGGSGDHLTLTNLNAIGGSGFADAGHDLMFLSNASKPINGNYFLPTTDGGIAGGVLTTDGAGTTSFQTLTSGVTRAWVNKYSILTNPTFGAGIGIPSNLDSTGSGSKNYTDVNFPVGSQLHIQACGSWNVNTTNLCGGQFVLAVGGGGFTITDVFELIAPVTTLNEVDTGLGYWSVDINIVRVGATTVRLGRVSVNSRLTSTSTINVPIVNSITNNPNGFTFGVPSFPFDIDLQWIDQSVGGQCFPVAGTYNHNVINANDTLAVTTNPSLDHNTLSNLTTGDPHSQYAKLSGKPLGQVLAGGVLPIHTLVLKSHDIGLPNVTVRDLNTEFNKNIDMSSNNIINVSEVNNTSNLRLSSVGGLLDIDSNLIQFTSTAVPQGQIDAVGGWEIFNNLSMTNNNINNVNALQATQVNTDTIENSGSGFLTFTNLGSYTPSFTSTGLDMNDGELTSVNNIRTNVQPILTINKNGSNATEIYGNSTIRRVQISNGVYLLTGTDLFCGNNDIRQCGNLEVSTINGITPSSGLFMGTSDGVLITATTAETSLLPATFVGSLTVPANGFQISSYHLVLAGNFSSNNGDNLTIRLKSNGTTLGTVVVPLNNSSGSSFEVEVDFQIRAVGGAGVADILSNFDFTYNQSGGGGAFVGERSISQNNTTFDTTISNTLAVTAQFSSTSVNNSIQTRVSKLTQTY
jgi:hypothetical protein